MQRDFQICISVSLNAYCYFRISLIVLLFCLGSEFQHHGIQQILFLQKKTVRIVNSQSKNFHTIPLFKQSSILKFQDKICLENISFNGKLVNNLASSVFLIFPWINITMKPQVLDKAIFLFRTNIYERYLKIASAVDSWNKIQEQLKNTLLKVYPIITLKQSLVIFISNHINNPLITFIHQEIIMIIKYIYIYNQM